MWVQWGNTNTPIFVSGTYFSVPSRMSDLPGILLSLPGLRVCICTGRCLRTEVVPMGATLTLLVDEKGSI
jgi:hypothetical protein